MSSGAPRVSRHAYGEDPSQFAELIRPAGAPRPETLVLLHGGFWRSAFGADHLSGVAEDLSRRGWVVWNVEYRRVGNGGGVSETLADVAAAIDYLDRVPETPAGPVVALGHSAGGHLATWAAGRSALAAVGRVPEPVVEVGAVVSLAGVVDLVSAARLGIGNGAVAQFMGGGPDDVPERYALADPMAHLPIAAAVRCVHARADDRVPFALSEAYVGRAREASMDASLVEARGDHFSVADARSPDWSTVLGVLEDLLAEESARSG